MTDAIFLRRCRRCKRQLAVTSFPPRGSAVGRGICSACLAAARADRKRAAWLKQNYRITLREYEALLGRQGGCCGVCGRPRPPKGQRQFAVDHCHRTGRIRGLLCTRCNRLLGHLGDDMESLMRFVRYLSASQPPPQPRRGRPPKFFPATGDCAGG